MALMRKVVDGLTGERLVSHTESPVGPGWPDEGETSPVRQCLLIVLDEECCHRMFPRARPSDPRETGLSSWSWRSAAG